MYGAVCDDGSCIYATQLCDGTFDCSDRSDERSCHPTLFSAAYEDCLLWCKDTCLDLNKICDHILDCIDATDETQCGHESYCHLKTHDICDDHNFCYDRSRNCDGFDDCSDGTDELYCLETAPKCIDDDRIMCDNGEITCIQSICSQYPVCKKDSGEKHICDDFGLKKSINITMRSNSTILISWIPSNTVRIVAIVYVKEYDTNLTILRKTVIVNDITVSNHRNCYRYYVRIEEYGRLPRSRRYTYTDSDFFSIPYNLNYSNISGILKWEFRNKECIPRMFYIECSYENHPSLINFHKFSYYLVPLHGNTICRVALCPKSIFNYSCSEFSDPIYIEVEPHTINHHLIFNIILLVIAVGGFLLLSKEISIFQKRRILKLAHWIGSLGSVLISSRFIRMLVYRLNKKQYKKFLEAYKIED